jgi:hypothetical protein
MLRSRDLLPLNPIGSCPCTKGMDLSKDPTHELCCRERTDDLMSKRRFACKKMLLETAKKFAEEMNEFHIIEAAMRCQSCSERLADAV